MNSRGDYCCGYPANPKTFKKRETYPHCYNESNIAQPSPALRRISEQSMINNQIPNRKYLTIPKMARGALMLDWLEPRLLLY